MHSSASGKKTNIWCLAGLGNPGREYSQTRHNLGFMVLDLLVEQLKFSWKRRALYSCAGDARRGLFLIKPLTFMNQSGLAVAKALSYQKIPASRLLVICDDVNLPLGKIRIRARGSDGGHNGLKSIIKHLSSQDFARLRLGVGPVPESLEMADFVLSSFAKAERSEVGLMTGQAAKTATEVIRAGVDKAIINLNQQNIS
ncbi:aminoacyl-tRNA hydrolase [candidate division TA06 bacterium]|uniref:Peptidyl-tRNA hydrolase n=1 Tax=candidate division TA06 bacterium TaxID=2250710 RepID=A0A933MI89_UNCT6|nr:aminoacyl-tRNA hydrolase [candidate division TA06 bacterium]